MQDKVSQWSLKAEQRLALIVSRLHQTQDNLMVPGNHGFAATLSPN
jgi:hypothetical protein